MKRNKLKNMVFRKKSLSYFDNYTFIDIKKHFYELITKFIYRTFQVTMCLFRYHIDKRLFWEGQTYNGFTKGFMKYFCNTFYSLYRSMLSPCFPYFGCHFNIYIYIYYKGEAFIWPPTYYNNDSSYVNIYSLGSLGFICIFSLPN